MCLYKEYLKECFKTVLIVQTQHFREEKYSGTGI